MTAIMIRNRYRRIVWFFINLLVSLVFWELFLPRLGFGRKVACNRTQRLSTAAIRFRTLAIQMGGVLIKVGQFLSARVDVLPPEITNELVGLQDEVPPVEFEEIRRLIESELAKPLHEAFVSFNPTPLAAASLGQVHAALLSNSDEPSSPTKSSQISVVVKVLRPNIEQIIDTDLAALKTVGKWLHRYKPIRRRANIPAILAEFSKLLYEEVDYLSEGRNAEKFAENFKGYKDVRVPIVFWSYTTKRVLTLENVYAIKITDYKEIRAAGISLEEVASRLLDTYLKQIFEDGFFHADPHPGNLFVHPMGDAGFSEDGALRWELTFVDFGMTGSLPPDLRQGLRELVIGVGTRDADRVVNAYQKMGMLLPDTDLEMLKVVGERAFDQFWGKDMRELTSISYDEIKNITREFREIIYEMPFQIPQNLISLARCVGILAGMCTGLDPKFNLWAHLAPYAKKIMSEEVEKTPEWWLSEAGKLVSTMVLFPKRLDHVMGIIERGELNVRSADITHQIRRIADTLHSLTYALVFAVFFLGGVQLYFAGNVLLSAITAGLGLVFAVQAIRNRR